MQCVSNSRKIRRGLPILKFTGLIRAQSPLHDFKRQNRSVLLDGSIFILFVPHATGIKSVPVIDTAVKSEALFRFRLCSSLVQSNVKSSNRLKNLLRLPTWNHWPTSKQLPPCYLLLRFSSILFSYISFLVQFVLFNPRYHAQMKSYLLSAYISHAASFDASLVAQCKTSEQSKNWFRPQIVLTRHVDSVIHLLRHNSEVHYLIKGIFAFG